MKNIIWNYVWNCYIIIVFILFASSAFSESISSTRKILDVDQNNPSGTYTSSGFSLQNYSRIRGMIISNGGSDTTPVVHLNQQISTSTVFWFGTHTVSMRYDGTYWKGEVNVPILGKYGRLIVGGFGNATNWQGYMYTTNEQGDRFVEAQKNETVNNVRLTYFVNKYLNTYGVAVDRFSLYNLGTASGFVYDDTGGSGTSSGSVAIQGYDINEIAIIVNSIVDGTVTIRVQEQIGTTTFWANVADVELGSATSYTIPLAEKPWNVRVGLNKTANGTASVSTSESYSTKIN